MKKNYLKPAMMVQTIQMGSLLNEGSLGVYGAKIGDSKSILSRPPNTLWDDEEADRDF